MWGSSVPRRPAWHLVGAGTCLLLLGVLVRHVMRKPADVSYVPGPSGENQAMFNRRSALGLGAAMATGSLPLALGEEAWADGNPFPYDKSRGKIAKKLAAFTPPGCPDPLIQVSLGPTGDQLRFVPDQLELMQGCYFELALANPSELEHNFVALEFAKAVYTVVVLAGSPPAEIKGPVTELELKPGASLGWFLVPVKAGEFQLKCTVAGHTEGGMVGKVSVKPRIA
mmetsp:Transcript_66078/g.158041  ORF Transcript_66078/g.158041 Transcript_66078/m.158041 type:complete len:226 (-) Transcript_66078:55-732(-)